MTEGTNEPPCFPQFSQQQPACPPQCCPHQCPQQSPTPPTAPARPRGSGTRTSRAWSPQGTSPQTLVRTCPQTLVMSPCWGVTQGGSELLCPSASSFLPPSALPDGLCPPQGGQSPPVPRGDTHRTPTPLRAATTMTSKALPTEAARDRGTRQGDLTLCDRGRAIPLLISPLDFLATSSVRGCGDRSWWHLGGCLDIKSFTQWVTVSLGGRGGCHLPRSKAGSPRVTQGISDSKMSLLWSRMPADVVPSSHRAVPKLGRSSWNPCPQGGGW